MKKLFTMMLAVVLVISLSAGVVFAKPAWKENKSFEDSDEIKWAQNAIEKLKLKGLLRGNGGKFFPSNTVKKIEAVVMALRIMEWEDEAELEKELPVKYKGKKVPSWAIGYVMEAYQKGILNDEDIRKFNPNAAAKRYEVAKYVIRALGYEEEAQEHMNEVLPFDDASSAPKSSIGYIYLINKLGIMQGDGKNFNPMGSLKRAEMAVLFNNLDGKVDTDIDDDEYTGILFSRGSDSIILKVGSEYKVFNVSDDVRVFDRRDPIDYDDLIKGSRIEIVVQNEVENDVVVNSEVVYIEVIDDDDDDDDKIISRYTGEITGISGQNPVQITVKIEDMLVIFKVTTDVEVSFKGVTGNFSEIKVGDEVTVTVNDRNWARKIYVHREREGQNVQQVEGTLTGIDLNNVYHLTIENTTYLLATNAAVEVDGNDADLEDLAVGMEVTATLDGNMIISVEAESPEQVVEGTVEEVGNTSIKVVVGDEEREYDFAGTLTIDIKDHDNDLGNIEQGMKVRLTLVNGLVTNIYAEDNILEVQGEITGIAINSNGYNLTLDVDDEEYVYDVSENVDIEITGIANAALSNLQVGQSGEFEIVNMHIVEIDITNVPD